MNLEKYKIILNFNIITRYLMTSVTNNVSEINEDS